MKKTFSRRRLGLLAAFMLCPLAHGWAAIDGISGTYDGGTNTRTFNLVAIDGFIVTPDANSVYMWGFAEDVLGVSEMQYPGPTLLVNEGEIVKVNVRNALPASLSDVANTFVSKNVSILFPGQVVTASGGVNTSAALGPLTNEAGPGGSVSYTFTASKPGTYQYHSGTNMDLQLEMGLVGALIVRASMAPVGTESFAYDHASTAYSTGVEYLFLVTDVDPAIHELAEAANRAPSLLEPTPAARYGEIDTSKRHPVYWFINGRNAPDTMGDAGVEWLPTQPYNAFPTMHPGQTMLCRMIGAGLDAHPFHTHANNVWILARDGRLLESAPGAGADLAVSNFTTTLFPGTTVDAVYTWTGAKLGWDIYGHAPGDPMQPNEYGPDHGLPFPVKLPTDLQLTFGETYSGSPFLGVQGDLPPGQGIGNLDGGYYFMWHSHNEREMCNNDIPPGGLMTMIVITPWP